MDKWGILSFSSHHQILFVFFFFFLLWLYRHFIWNLPFSLFTKLQQEIRYRLSFWKMAVVEMKPIEWITAAHKSDITVRFHFNSNSSPLFSALQIHSKFFSSFFLFHKTMLKSMYTSFKSTLSARSEQKVATRTKYYNSSVEQKWRKKSFSLVVITYISL